jgi:hypothetical protein
LTTCSLIETSRSLLVLVKVFSAHCAVGSRTSRTGSSRRVVGVLHDDQLGLARARRT